MTLKQVIEALVFASPKPLSTKEIAAALKAAGHETEDEEALAYAKTTEEETASILDEIRIGDEAEGRPFRLSEQVNGWTYVTDPVSGRWVRQLYPEAKPTRLSGPALETLAIIAYRQPVTRGDIEAVRGVAVDGVMQVLLERGLVKIAGRAEVPGRPLLYSTTEYFLQHFGLKAVDELPNADELRKVVLPQAIAEAEATEKKSRKAAAAAATAATTAAPTPVEPAPEKSDATPETAPEESATPESVPETVPVEMAPDFEESPEPPADEEPELQVDYPPEPEEESDPDSEPYFFKPDLSYTEEEPETTGEPAPSEPEPPAHPDSSPEEPTSL